MLFSAPKVLFFFEMGVLFAKNVLFFLGRVFFLSAFFCQSPLRSLGVRFHYNSITYIILYCVIYTNTKLATPSSISRPTNLYKNSFTCNSGILSLFHFNVKNGPKREVVTKTVSRSTLTIT